MYNLSMQNLKIPTHIAFIMDGNGRWAKAKKLPRSEGHEEGARSVKEITETAKKIGIKYITLYAFSTENWSRSPSEISALMELLNKTLDNYEKEKDSGVRLIVSGRRDRLPANTLKKLDEVIKSTAHNKQLTVNLALNYGARQEITDAVNRLISQGKTKITESDISTNLYNTIPDPDLIIRTSGEERLSNFLLWQAAYSEFYFTDTLWPDFKEPQFMQAIEEYSRRERRFGARKE